MNDAELTFDARDWVQRIGQLSPARDAYWTVMQILGPHDICRLLKIRELIAPYAQFGKPSPADLFILSLGEPPSRDCTRIGGLPFWGRDRKWPTAADGKLLPFLAQFNCGRSLDIVGEAPGDMLLIFANPDCHNGIVVEWEKTSRRPALVTNDDVPVLIGGPIWYGERWRIASYPKATLTNDSLWDGIELQDGREILDSYFVFDLVGVQISEHPALAPPNIIADDGERIVCSLCSIWPTIGVPYPFINYASPITESESRRFSLTLGNHHYFDAYGIIYVVRGADGTFKGKVFNI